MNKKSKLLKIWMKTAISFAALAAFVSFTGPLSAGWIYDGDDPQNNRRLVKVVFGTATHAAQQHPDPNRTAVHAQLGDENTVRTYMRNTLPPIDRETHIQFWHSQDEGTRVQHTLRALSGAAGAQANAYTYAIQNLGLANIANVTFSLHQK